MKKKFIENSGSFFDRNFLRKKILLDIYVLFVRVDLHVVLILITHNVPGVSAVFACAFKAVR